MPEVRTPTASSSSASRSSSSFPAVMITQEMIDEATRLIPVTKVERTTVSPFDTLAGHLGEFAFAQFMFGDWKKNRVGMNKGEPDFPGYEIKTSAFPFSESLHLLVREEYARKRKPDYYIQVIIDIGKGSSGTIPPHTKAILCGFATADEVDAAPLRDFGSKFGGEAGYRCRYIEVKDLHPMEELTKVG